MDEEIRWILSNIPDEQKVICHHKLVIYATWRFGKWVRRTGSREIIMAGHSPEDIANEAWKKLCSGDREWKYELHPDDRKGHISQATIESLMIFMMSSIKSLVHTLGHSAQYQSSVYLDDVTSKVNDEGESYEAQLRDKDVVDFLQSPRLSPEDELFFKEVRDQILQCISDKADLLKLFTHLCNGLEPAEIAFAMKIDVNDVYDMKRRFLRRARPVYEELMPRNGEPNVEKEERE